MGINKYEPIVEIISPEEEIDNANEISKLEISKIKQEVLSKNGLSEYFSDKTGYVMKQIKESFSHDSSCHYSYNADADIIDEEFLEKLKDTVMDLSNDLNISEEEIYEKITIETLENQSLDDYQVDTINEISSLGVNFAVDDCPESNSVENLQFFVRNGINAIVKIDWKYFQSTIYDKEKEDELIQTIADNVNHSDYITIINEGIEDMEFLKHSNKIKNKLEDIIGSVKWYMQGFIFLND